MSPAFFLTRLSPFLFWYRLAVAAQSMKTECLGSGLAHTVLELTGLHHTKLKRLSDDGVIDLSRVPDDLKLNALQERVKRSVLSGKIGGGARSRHGTAVRKLALSLFGL